MAEGKDNEAPGLPGKDIGIELIKELTLSNIEVAKMLHALVVQIGGAPGTEQHPEGLAGLIDQLGAVGEAINALDERMTGLSLTATRYSFVADKMLDIRRGNPDAKPPLAPREPILSDFTDALVEYDKQLEEEALRDSEDVDAAVAADHKDAAAKDAPEEPEKELKPPMIGNLPTKPATMAPMPGKGKPPLPVAPPKPASTT